MNLINPSTRPAIRRAGEFGRYTQKYDTDL